jgi:hypothetical protein
MVLQPETLIIEPVVLTLLDLLSTPKSIEEVLLAELSIEASERRPLVRLLHRIGAIEGIHPPRSCDVRAWWDPHDRAKYEASLLTLVQVAPGF